MFFQNLSRKHSNITCLLRKKNFQKKGVQYIVLLRTSSHTLSMPRAVHFTSEIKEIFFRVIDFIENEKTGPHIPMNDTTARIISMLGISESSLFNLKEKMKAVREAREVERKEEEQKRLCLQSSSQIHPAKTSHKKQNVSP